MYSVFIYYRTLYGSSLVGALSVEFSTLIVTNCKGSDRRARHNGLSYF